VGGSIEIVLIILYSAASPCISGANGPSESAQRADTKIINLKYIVILANRFGIICARSK
jgi:hypothetical protein